MPAGRKKNWPPHVIHRPNGQDIVRVWTTAKQRLRITLGRTGSPEAQAEYERLVKLLEANGRLFPAEGLPPPPQTRKVADLKPHPDNLRIYGDAADAELVESIRTKGVLEPLLITLDNLIVSGHRRWRAAQAAGLTEVPVVVITTADELDIIEALVESNRQRVKTNEQLGREAKALRDVEKQRAERRRREGAAKAGKASGVSRRGEANVQESVPERSHDEQGQARDKVGEKLRISGKTAERAAAVVEKIDALREDGQSAAAEQLRQILNTKGVGPAYDQAKGQEQPKKAKGARDRDRDKTPSAAPAEDAPDRAKKKANASTQRRNPLHHLEKLCKLTEHLTTADGARDFLASLVRKWTVERKKKLAEKVRSLDVVLGWLADVLEAPKQSATQGSDDVAVPGAS
jgi:ParB/RepB/Spo0J family partition protein